MTIIRRNSDFHGGAIIQSYPGEDAAQAVADLRCMSDCTCGHCEILADDSDDALIIVGGDPDHPILVPARQM